MIALNQYIQEKYLIDIDTETENLIYDKNIHKISTVLKELEEYSKKVRSGFVAFKNIVTKSSNVTRDYIECKQALDKLIVSLSLDYGDIDEILLIDGKLKLQIKDKVIYIYQLKNHVTYLNILRNLSDSKSIRFLKSADNYSPIKLNQ